MPLKVQLNYIFRTLKITEYQQRSFFLMTQKLFLGMRTFHKVAPNIFLSSNFFFIFDLLFLSKRTPNEHQYRKKRHRKSGSESNLIITMMKVMMCETSP